jgi:ankyrin repeat protein
MPLQVQEAVIDCLHRIAEQDTDDIERKADAFLNLAVAYVNGHGIGYDLTKAADFLITAASLGSKKAQRLYVDIFFSVPESERLNKSQELEWLRNAVRLGNRRALSRIQSEFEDDDATEQRIFRYTESMGKVSPANNNKQELVLADNMQEWTNWRQLFLRFAVIHELCDLSERLLSQDGTLVNKCFANEETPLLLASRMGSTAMSTLLISKGADPKLKMTNGITPLHWLVAFDETDKLSIASLYVAHGADFDAMADLSGGKPFSITVFETPINGAPLHWAIAENDVAAVDALLSIGANPRARTFSRPPQIGLTCLELAASLSRSTIMRNLLSISSVRAEVRDFRRLDETAPVMIQPLFYVLQMSDKWHRLLQSGPHFEEQTRETLQLLIEHGATTDTVLQFKDVKMSAAFATAYHHCGADIMRSGIELGFRDDIDSTFGGASSGGNALMLAITHQDRDMFDVLLNAGAKVTAVDKYGFGLLHRVAKETDNVYFASRLLSTGVELEPTNPTLPNAFYFAVHAGHFEVASFLFDKGADRDRMCSNRPITILGEMLFKHTMNAAKRVEYLLTLPDRGSDGFIANRFRGWPGSVFHSAVSVLTENPADNEVTRVMISLLMSKYTDVSYLNNTEGPHHGSVLGMATEIGNYQVVRQLLHAGANPNIQDEYGRTPLDLLYWRYYYPALTVALAELDDISDRLLVGRILRYVNENTEELLSLLTSYEARTNIFSPPVWAPSSPGLRSLDWVMQRLQEDRTRKREEQEQANVIPNWGGLPIRIPGRPMQFHEAPPDSSNQSNI